MIFSTMQDVKKIQQKKDHPVIGGLKCSSMPKDFNGLETTQKEVPFCLVDTFSRQEALSVYPIP